MTTVLLSLLLGAEVLSPPIPVQAASGAPVQVAAEPGTVDLTLANRSAVAVWADQRRVQGLLTSTQVVTPVADLWVRVLDGGTAARPVCFQRSPVLATRVTSTSTGRVGIAWRRGATGELVLSVMDANRQFEGDPCGSLFDTATTGRPAVVAVGEAFRLAWETDAGVFGFVNPRDGGVLAPPRLLFPAGCAQPVLADTPDGSYAGALCAGGALALRNANAAEPVTPELATAFTLVPDLDGPVLLRVDGMGQVWFHLVAAQPAFMTSQSVAGRQPLAVNANESVLSALENGGATQVTNEGRMALVQGVPVALAATASTGLVATQLDSGVVRGSELKVTAGALVVSAAESITTARVLQRRPSVAWWDDAQRWLMTWEEATAPNTWIPRAVIVDRPGVLRPLAMPSNLSWPRVLRQPDGGVRLYGREGVQTLVYTLMVDGGFSSADTVPFVARGGVAGVAHTYWWSDTLSQLRREYVDGLGGPGLSGSGDVEVSCATWFEGADGGGEFVVARELPTSSAIARFAEGVAPDSFHQTLQTPQACVSARPGTSQVALLVGRPGVLQLTRSTGAGMQASTLSADAGAWGLQLAPTSTGWLVAYNSDAGVFAVSVDDEGSTPPRYYRLDTTGVAHGNPSVAAAPTGAVAVTWASLIGDSVELRLRIFDPAVADGGVDGGSVDAGFVDAGDVDAGGFDGGADAGVLDAGMVDAGMVDAGGVDGGMVDAGPMAVEEPTPLFVPVCGCGASGDASLLMAMMLVLAAGGMRRRG